MSLQNCIFCTISITFCSLEPVRHILPRGPTAMPPSSAPAVNSASTRKAVIQEITKREVRSVSTAENGANQRTSEYFGANTFGVRQMRDKLPRDTYAKLLDAVKHGQKLDAAIAPRVAQAIKEWALSHGATHFTHWFQPQTGLTA